LKDIIIAFFLALGFASGSILSVYTIEAHRQQAETTAILETMKNQVRSMQDAAKECNAVIDTRKVTNRNIDIKKPSLPPRPKAVPSGK